MDQHFFLADEDYPQYVDYPVGASLREIQAEGRTYQYNIHRCKYVPGLLAYVATGMPLPLLRHRYATLCNYFERHEVLNHLATSDVIRVFEELSLEDPEGFSKSIKL